jgi:aromatic ring-cleaving dioxygenase
LIFILFSFDEKTLSILTSPNSHGNHVEVQVDDVVFVGHTLGLENNTNLKSFAIFFVLRVRRYFFFSSII